MMIPQRKILFLSLFLLIFGSFFVLLSVLDLANSLKDLKYIINIDANFTNKGLPYGHKFIKAENKNAKTILFSTNICHPS